MKLSLELFVLSCVYALSVGSAVPSHDKIVGCYWGTWSFYRTGYGKFDVDQIDPSLCTHGFYGFADLNNVTFEVKIYDPWYDQAPNDANCENGKYCHYDSYRRFINLKTKEPNFKPMLSIGGWNAGSASYSQMAADPAKRNTFITSLGKLLDTYPFDGIDFDWEYPGAREGSDPEHDKENFSQLVKEMAEMLHARGLLLSAALSPNVKTVEIGYDLPFLSQYFDFMNVMAYDYHGWWGDHFFTGHNSPLYGRVEEEVEGHPGWKFNIFDSMKAYLDGGVPKEKLVMGMPIYGRGFVLNETSENGLYCGAHEGIPAGPYTRQNGIWGNQEIYQAFNNETLINLPGALPKSWTVVTDDCYHAPYAFNGPYWIGYDNKESFELKAKYINFLEIGGAMVWSIDTDDFRGDYGQPFGMMRVIHDTLATDNTFNPEKPMCTGSAPMCSTFDPTTPMTTPTPLTTTSEYTGECTSPNDVIPYPGDCHKYYMCLANANGGYDLQEFTCGDWVFDPNIDACTDSNLPSNDYLCNE